MCVDFCALNMQTKWDVYPLPCIEDLLDCLFAAHYFSKIDLAIGVPLGQDHPGTPAL